MRIRRIDFVTPEVVHPGGVVVYGAVSPYRATRNDVCNMVGSERFVEAFLDTPIEVCEQRDAKGMSAKARRGEIPGLTGIDDSYEPPLHAEITVRVIPIKPLVARASDAPGRCAAHSKLP